MIGKRFKILMIDNVSFKEVMVSDESRYWIQIVEGKRELRIMKNNIISMELLK